MDAASLATLLSCSYEAGMLTRTGLISAGEIPDELPLALLQISSWPTDSVTSGLTGRLELRLADQKRILSENGEPLAVIEENPSGTRRIQLPRYRTTISIRTTNQP